MNLFMVDVYRNHKMVELVVRIDGDEQAAIREVKRCWNGWEIRSIHEPFNVSLIWKINEWSTD